MTRVLRRIGLTRLGWLVVFAVAAAAGVVTGAIR